ncbi:hypothetical protein [Legionella sp. W05-934-2]|jgi:hypothetical protein|uniref:hypothetical protein n=1 Tax=Legionella sp. W05-934-2 TaxID=1198649 RepID=UPI0034627F03
MTKATFKRALYDLLKPHEINIESGIVNQFAFEILEINPSGQIDDDRHGFDLSQSLYGSDPDVIHFNLPELSLEDLYKCLDYFNIPRNEYKTNSPLTIGEDAARKFVHDFEEYFKNQVQNERPEINDYQIKSKALLESSAIETIQKYAEEISNYILSHKLQEQSQTFLLMLLSMEVLKTMSSRYKLDEFPDIYKIVIAAKTEVDKLLQFNVRDPFLAKALPMVKAGIESFEKYQRYQSVIDNKAFEDMFEKHLQIHHQVSEHASNIAPNLVLNLADAHLGPHGKCQMSLGSDKSRMCFRYTDISEENAQKIVNYFRGLGDITARIGNGNKVWASYIPESAAAFSMSRTETDNKPLELERHSIEIDGSFLKNTLMSMLMKAVSDLDTNTLAHYQKLSQPYLEQLEKERKAKEEAASKEAQPRSSRTEVSSSFFFTSPEETDSALQYRALFPST